MLLALVVLLSAPACSRQTNAPQASGGRNPYYLENEITTTEDLNDGRMVIVMDTQYNVSTTDIEQVVESQFPEVNVILCLQNTPGDGNPGIFQHAKGPASFNE